ncbi:imm11 family protein [Desertivirga arenae]|uniref:imm11 family protein n=1 Tax=Desertivirga arenae TaxID=2810309 RepID=UPI001A96C058|nr:DUF1629 domain-containing protein [Pedobacter sp. SYSU D00823]
MIFYQLKFSVGKEIGTTFPQSQRMVSELSIDDPRHLWNLEGKLDESAYIPDSILHPKARLTDLISSSPISKPIVSTKLKDLILTLREEGIQFLPAQVVTKKGKTRYWLMNGYTPDYHLIDFDRSLISLKRRDENGTVSKPLELKSSDDYVKALNSVEYPKFVCVEKLVLLDNTIDNIIYIDRVSSSFFFSQKAKDAIEESNFTGITFEIL